MAKKKSSTQSAQRPGFEEVLRKLEGIVHLFEEGDIDLSEALARYEEGVKLLRWSYDLLQNAERRIELLCGVDADGNPTTQPLDDRATESLDGKAGGRGPRRSAPRDTGGQPPHDPHIGETGVDTPRGLF